MGYVRYTDEQLAERAEALLLGEAGRAEAAALLPEAMLTLACAHAESTARLRPAADDGKMRADERAALLAFKAGGDPNNDLGTWAAGGDPCGAGWDDEESGWLGSSAARPTT